MYDVHILYMDDLRFTRDPAKAAANARKHGVDFAEAVTAFADERGLLLDDPDHSTGEARFILLGLSRELRLLVVVHRYPGRDDTVRLISARKAISTERTAYEERRRE